MKKFNSFEDLAPLRRKITGEKRQRIRISRPVRITEEEIENFEPIDTRLMKRARQLDKEIPLLKITYEYRLFGEWKPCEESDLNMLKESGFQTREIQVPCSRVKDLKAKYHIKRWLSLGEGCVFSVNHNASIFRYFDLIRTSVKISKYRLPVDYWVSLQALISHTLARWCAHKALCFVEVALSIVSYRLNRTIEVMLDSIVERINPATKKNLLLGSNRMAIEIVNLCPEKLNLVEDPKDLLISKSLKQLLVAGIPFRTGCEYIIPLQLNHATKFTIQGKDVISPRFFLAEFDSERVTAVRTVSVRELESEFYLPELVDGKLTAPKIKAKVASTGGWTVDKSSIVTPKVSTVTGALPVVDNNSRAQVIVATRLKYLGRVDGYTEKFIQTNGKWQLAVKDGFVELIPQRYHRFEVIGEVKDIQDVLTTMKNGTPECTKYLL